MAESPRIAESRKLVCRVMFVMWYHLHKETFSKYAYGCTHVWGKIWEDEHQTLGRAAWGCGDWRGLERAFSFTYKVQLLKNQKTAIIACVIKHYFFK